MKKNKPFPKMSGKRQGVYSLHSYSIVLEFLTRARRQEEEIEGK
jgi:hypothetical protein